MADLAEQVQAAPVHEFQVVHRVRPADGPGGWQQYQCAWSNAADAHRWVDEMVELNGLDQHELVGAAAERAAETAAPPPSAPPAADAGELPADATTPGGGM